MFERLLSCMAVLCAALLLAACELVSEEAPATIAEPTEEVSAPTPTITVTVTNNANVRAGPGTEHDIRFWLTADTPVHVSGRNADGDWLQIEHEGQVGWLFGALTDIGAEVLAALPGTSAPPAITPEPVVEPTVTPDPAAALEPTPTPLPEPAEEPAPEAQTPVRTTATVTGSTVNLRTGPGTEHAIDGQVRAGEQLHVTGRSAAGDWKNIARTHELVETDRDRASRIVETWSYDPAALSAARTVDPLSLYARFRDHRDERVSMAAERLLDGLPW